MALSLLGTTCATDLTPNNSVLAGTIQCNLSNYAWPSTDEQTPTPTRTGTIELVADEKGSLLQGQHYRPCGGRYSNRRRGSLEVHAGQRIVHGCHGRPPDRQHRLEAGFWRRLPLRELRPWKTVRQGIQHKQGFARRAAGSLDVEFPGNPEPRILGFNEQHWSLDGCLPATSLGRPGSEMMTPEETTPE